MNRSVFFDRVRARPFAGALTQGQATEPSVRLS